MQPEEENPGDIRESVISGEVIQPQEQVNEQTTFFSAQQPQSVIIDPHTGLPQNILIIQEPSAAPKVIGILVIIYGSILTVISILGIIGFSYLTDSDSDLYVKEVADSPTLLYALTGLSILCYIAQILGGMFMIQKRKIGIYITWLSLLILFIADAVLELNYAGLSQTGFGTSINLGFSVVCSGICCLLVAIPLMISDNGMDDSFKIL
tara:strand:- start:152 stop:775 length:624 start_codon:yes stop_codon:yes gene_type:complete